MLSTVRGMQMEVSRKQHEKAPAPIVESCESDSNSTVDRLAQPVKHESEIARTV
jgi:hypothetical protein